MRPLYLGSRWVVLICPVWDWGKTVRLSETSWAIGPVRIKRWRVYP
jgi:hypothetical protein